MDPDRSVIRETDSNDVLPEAGTTRNLVSVWKTLESTDSSPASRQRPTPEVSWPESEAESRNAVEHQRFSPEIIGKLIKTAPMQRYL